MRRFNSLAALLFVLAVLITCGVRNSADTAVPVVAIVETTPVPSQGDAADDPAIWVHPEDPVLSTIIGTDKDRGLAVYDLSGRELQFLPDGEMNNVDLRYGFQLDGQPAALATAGNQADGSIAIYRVNPRTRTLEDVAARRITSMAGMSPEPGSCMYRSPVDGRYYYIVNGRFGLVEQWRLYDNGAGKVDAEKVRSFRIGFSTEGCVADDELGYLYIGLEDKGIWRFKAEPSAGSEHIVIDTTDADGHLTSDVEGLTLYYGARRTGYLVASSQGSNELIVYKRESNNDYVMTLRVVGSSSVDRVTHTDGIDVANANLGPVFPKGLLVAQDDMNDEGNQNFKLVSWRSIAAAMRFRSSSESF